MKQSLYIMLALLCAAVQGAWAQSEQDITFVSRTWDKEHKVVVSKDSTATATNIRDLIDPNNSSRITVRDKTIYVTGSVDLTDTDLYVAGQTSLILCDDAELKLHHLLVEDYEDVSTLHIYGQSNDTGHLLVNERRTSSQIDDNLFRWDVGIGPIRLTTGCRLYFHGGNVESYGTNGSPAIGSQTWSINDAITGIGEEICIFGGTVKADSRDNGSSGIGYRFKDINIYGGTVKAYGNSKYAGIEGSFYSGLVVISIYNGNVEAWGGYKAAGIGGDADGPSGFISIHGGEVRAYGGGYAAGIGGGINGSGCIGSGGYVEGHEEYGIVITGGLVIAWGHIDAAGIGGGEDGDSGNILISGGTVRARGVSNGAGIGAGEDGKVNTIAITGGTVDALGGSDDGPAIGTNLSGDAKGTLILADAMMVNAGNNGSEDNRCERRFTNNERVPACLYRKYAKITACHHDTPTYGNDRTEAISYTIGNNNTHTRYCRYCNDTQTVEHQYADNVCVCGHVFNAATDEWTVTLYQADPAMIDHGNTYDSGTVYRLSKAKAFSWPDLNIDGVKVMALVKDPASPPTKIWLTDEEIASKENYVDPSQPIPYTTDVNNINIYVRYRLDFTTTWEWGTDGEDNIDTQNVYVVLTCPAFANLPIQCEDISIEETADEKTYRAIVDHEYDNITYRFIDVKHVHLYDDNIDILDNDSNYILISDYTGRTVNATLKGRTLYKDNSWNTIYLPFELSAEQLADVGCPLYGATIKELESSAFADGTLTLNFSAATAMEAGVPYLVKWAAGENITNPVFQNVTISNNNGHIYTDHVAFQGSYNPLTITAGIIAKRQLLYLGADNTLYYPNAEMTIKACRGYFALIGLTAGDLEASPVKAFVLNFDDGNATGIRNPESSRMEGGAWYDLSGRQVAGHQPANRTLSRGIYIHNGKKVVVK